MARSLFDIREEVLSVLSGDDELTPETEAMLAELSISFELKAEAVMQYALEQEAKADACRAEADRLACRADRFDKRADSLKKYILASMQRVGFQKVSTDKMTLSVCKSPLSVKLDGAIPDGYAREKTTVEFNKSLALENYKKGEMLPDNVTIEQNYHLRLT